MDKHKINDKALLKRLNEEIMKKRDTKESVLLKLDELLEDMGDPKGYLEMKLEAAGLRPWGCKRFGTIGIWV
ncbi:STK36 [Symbiodinium sp. CCMP2592]|nr:STK36 [Symbiodinium sp. CCMP2592]